MKPLLFSCLCVMSFLASNAQVKDVIHSSDHQSIIWLPVNLISLQSKTTTIYGHPKLVDSKYGPVIHFDGLKDAIFLSEMPIAQLKKLTIEMIFYPDSGGNFEQRLLHFGEILSNRLLLETRSTTSGWYFDAFIYSGTQKNTLIDSTLLHPLNRWYHLAYVVDNGKLTTYVDGQKELESQINMIPLLTGKTSIGVRQNNKSWFKGSIYKIKITPKALHPKQFIKE